MEQIISLEKAQKIERFQAEQIIATRLGALSFADLARKTLDGTFTVDKRSYKLASEKADSVHQVNESVDKKYELTSFDSHPIESLNKRKLVAKGVDFATLEPTATGLKKSILDATYSVRQVFKAADYHDYSTQQQGPEHKVIKTSLLIYSDKVKDAKTSLYRPNTKSGDPRIWFSGLSSFSAAGDKVALIIAGNQLLLINLSRHLLTDGCYELAQVSKLMSVQLSTADELLSRLKKIAADGLLKATRKGSTAVGMAIEDALGLPPNSSKQPDYNGIELKAGRGRGNRATLFAQVADWKVSPYKSSADILNAFGYQRGEHYKLYCTISSKKPNSQGLQFRFDEKNDQLIEFHNDVGDVACWPADLLRSRLLEKHKETFWIDAESIYIKDEEYFKLKSITHTKNPLINQLMPLLVDGTITMDHLIKRMGTNKSRVSEKGPLFKMDKKDLSLLFPEPITYELHSIE
ncbi:MvaI/BcnI family restriction endonuclease [Pseudoalteromonas rubra]|uniref:MvaI/BcnI family restriction endonuclease n=1 Tax=Pseudoalteromonas rubra TaxID=43658 RepID=UPI0011099980|nr:MvaI/BcnI family restriction endonuclease [Pseudoalteromonas rubra]